MNAMATAPNGAIPVTRAWRDKARRSLQANDTKPEDLRRLLADLVDFFPADEPEPAEDGAKTLYVHRPLRNGADVVKWAREAGFGETLTPDDMHVTLAFSTKPVDVGKDNLTSPRSDTITSTKGARSVKPLGDKGAVVLRFDEPVFAERWQEFRDAGASWDHKGFQPHVTITYKGADVDLSKITAYAGPLEFGPEVFRAVNPKWLKDVKHAEDALAYDRLPLASDLKTVRDKDDDGRMRVAVANISKACVNPYKGSEIPGCQALGLEPHRVYKLLRDPEELRKAAPSFNGIQVMRKHIPVNAEDHQPWDVVGSTGTEAEFEPPYLKNSLTIWVKDAIKDIESEEKRELSCGYRYRPDMVPGTYEGEAYDGVMRDIVGNHVALVTTGRAGPDVMVGDAAMATDPPVSEKQRRAMFAAAEGKSNLGITEKVGKEFVGKDARNDEAKPMTKKAMDAFPKAACDWLKGKMSEDDFKEFSAKDAWPDDVKAKDESEEEAEKKKKEAEDKKAMDAKSAKDKKAADKKAKDEEEEAEEVSEGKKDVKEHAEDKGKAKDEKEDMVSKGAMDEAIEAACNATAKSVEAKTTTSVEARMRDRYEAARIVKEYIGDIEPMAFDSGDAIKQHCLKSLGVKDYDKLTGAALDIVLGYQRKAGARPVERGAPKLGMDAAVKADAKKYAPGIEHITIGV